MDEDEKKRSKHWLKVNLLMLCVLMEFVKLINVLKCLLLKIIL